MGFAFHLVEAATAHLFAKPLAMGYTTRKPNIVGGIELTDIACLLSIMQIHGIFNLSFHNKLFDKHTVVDNQTNMVQTGWQSRNVDRPAVILWVVGALGRYLLPHGVKEAGSYWWSRIRFYTDVYGRLCRIGLNRPADLVVV